MATMNWEKLKVRYESASPTAKIEGLCLNLIRLQTLAESGVEASVAHHLVRESQFFIEWMVPRLNLETYMAMFQELLSLQRLLSRWKLGWSELWNTTAEREKMANAAQHWYEHLQGYLGAIAS